MFQSLSHASKNTYDWIFAELFNPKHNFFLSFFSNWTGIDQNNISFINLVNLVKLFRKNGSNYLSIIDVHLAAIGFDMVRRSISDDHCFSLTVYPHEFLEVGNTGNFLSLSVVAKVGQKWTHYYN